MIAVARSNFRRKALGPCLVMPELELRTPVNDLDTVELRQRVIDREVHDRAPYARVAQRLVERCDGNATRVDGFGAIRSDRHLLLVHETVHGCGGSRRDVGPDRAGQRAVRFAEHQRARFLQQSPQDREASFACPTTHERPVDTVEANHEHSVVLRTHRFDRARRVWTRRQGFRYRTVSYAVIPRQRGLGTT